MGKAGPRLWRASNPNLSDDVRETWVKRLMDGRRAVRDAKGDPEQTTKARKAPRFLATASLT